MIKNPSLDEALGHEDGFRRQQCDVNGGFTTIKVDHRAVELAVPHKRILHTQ